MTTRPPPKVAMIYTLIDPSFKTEKRGGIVGDSRHGSGYHLSPDDLRARGLWGSDYSSRCPADVRGAKLGNGEWAAGIDITFGSLSELITCHKRLRDAATPDSEGNYDPRIEPVREFGGTLNGKTVSGYNRVATGSGSRSQVGWVSAGFMDSSHLWHEHISILRDRVEDENDMIGVAEIIAGVAPGTFGWKGDSSAVPSAPKDDNDENEEGIDMGVISPKDFAAKLAEADVIAAPDTRITAKNKTWTLRGYLVDLVKGKDSIQKEQRRQAEQLNRIEALLKKDQP